MLSKKSTPSITYSKSKRQMTSHKSRRFLPRHNNASRHTFRISTQISPVWQTGLANNSSGKMAYSTTKLSSSSIRLIIERHNKGRALQEVVNLSLVRRLRERPFQNHMVQDLEAATNSIRQPPRLEVAPRWTTSLLFRKPRNRSTSKFLRLFPHWRKLMIAIIHKARNNSPILPTSTKLSRKLLLS